MFVQITVKFIPLYYIFILLQKMPGKKQSDGFKLPIFRPETQKNLEASRITERDRCYIVRTLATMLLATNPQPHLSDCSVPAKALVDAYPFLADVSDDGDNGHVRNNGDMMYNMLRLTSSCFFSFPGPNSSVRGVVMLTELMVVRVILLGLRKEGQIQWENISIWKTCN